jgi:hypothetical protein
MLGLAAGTAGAAPPKVPEHIIFPVVGQVSYVDDFGAPRPGGAHQANDLVAAKKSPAVAAESGTVKYWTTSRSAGCMLYLYGESGTVYYYIHLNNDLTLKNDNRGKCVAGTAYAKGLKDGARVAAGQLVGYVGDSGDADGIHPHLHFEVHPGGKAAVDPYPYLQSAQRLLFLAKPGSPFVVTLGGTVASATVDKLQVTVATLQVFPFGFRATKLAKPLTISVPATALVQQKGAPVAARLLAAHVGQAVTVWTQPALASLKAELGADGALAAALVQLG